VLVCTCAPQRRGVARADSPAYPRYSDDRAVLPADRRATAASTGPTATATVPPRRRRPPAGGGGGAAAAGPPGGAAAATTEDLLLRRPGSYETKVGSFIYLVPTGRCDVAATICIFARCLILSSPPTRD
jgi:hypothetical protein